MSIKQMGVSVLARALAAGLFATATLVSVSPAAAALSVSDMSQVNALSRQIQNAVTQAQADAQASPACGGRSDCNTVIEAAVQAAIERAILQSGANPEVANAALGQARSALRGSLTSGANAAFGAVAANIEIGSNTTAAGGGSGGSGGGGGGLGAGFSGLNGGSGGGSGYRAPN